MELPQHLLGGLEVALLIGARSEPLLDEAKALLERDGVNVVVVSPHRAATQAAGGPASRTLDSVDAAAFDGLLLLGGAGDAPDAAALLDAASQDAKPVARIADAQQLAAELDRFRQALVERRRHAALTPGQDIVSAVGEDG